ncbi:hypothetical protein CEB3_c42190 [Peptococcaceae bacterium CEB3]|nr:hypothetical protein CEB3_c42190 [Peptococcaceae bacterium CEB3]
MKSDPAGGIIFDSSSQARSSKEHALVFLLWAALLAHGLFFARDLLALALLPGLYLLFRRDDLRAAFHSLRVKPREGTLELTATDALLLLMSGLSLTGLLHPVKAEEGWLEAIRFLLYWFVYRWGREAARNSKGEERLMRAAGWAALALGISAWLPWAAHVWPPPGPPEAGRLSSWFGYPNAAAAFLGAVLLLPRIDIRLKLVLIPFFLSTGSRAGLALFLGILVLQGLIALKSGVKPSQAEPGRRTRCVLSESINFRRDANLGVRGRLARLFGRSKRGAGRGFLVTVGFLAASAVLCWQSGLIGPAAPFHGAWAHLGRWAMSDSVWERILYFRDGLRLAASGGFLPQAGGWLAFPLVQQIPYWASDPHCSLIRVLLNQGWPGLLSLTAWSASRFRQIGRTGLWGACVFLALHSLVDADFSFAALGVLFWLLVALAEGRDPAAENRGQGGRKRWGEKEGHRLSSARVRPAGIRVLRPAFLEPVLALLLFAPAGVLLAAGGLPAEAGVMGRPGGPPDAAVYCRELTRALSLDRTNVGWRRELAETELLRGEIAPGLNQVERVLAWQKFDLGSWEWAQSLVWQAAERQRRAGTASSRGLYRWVAAVPARITAIARTVPVAERGHWRGYALFVRDDPHIELLARCAGDVLHNRPLP